MPDPRVGVEPKEESTQPPIKLEISPSGRSTCRITNEKIPKGATRHAAAALTYYGQAKVKHTQQDANAK
jgi:hypothetical protein